MAIPSRYYNLPMELRLLRYFVAVAEELNFTRAARRLHIAQPPLSRQIRQLEELIGVPLLVRDRRPVALTLAGKVLLREARIVLHQVQHALDLTRRSKKSEPRIIRVGIANGLGERVHPVLAAHYKRFPAVDVQCQDVFSTFQNDALRALKIDVGFLRPPVDTLHLQSQPLFKERFMALLPKSSRLAKRKKLRIRQLANETLLLHKRDVSSGVYDKVLELYRAAGVAPRVVHTRTGPWEEVGTMLVASGKGIYIGVGAVLSHPVLGSEVAAVALSEPGATIDVHMAWRRGEASPLVLDFLHSARQVFR
jgi:DNA-binding transcriptional LysR family regulator